MKKLALKSIKFFLTVLATAFMLYGYTATITSAQDGTWNVPATWVGGIVPVAGDDVVIVHQVILTADVAEILASITIGPDNGSDFLVETYDIETSGDLKITGQGKISTKAGAYVTVGNGTEDGFIMEGSQMDVAGGRFDVYGYFHLNSGQFNVAPNGVDIYVAIAGTRDDDFRIIYFDQSVVLNLTGGEVNLTLENSNTGLSEEVYFEEVSILDNTGYINLILNNSSTTDDYGVFLGFLINDLTIDIGSGNLCEIQKVPGFTGDEFVFEDIQISSGSFRLISGTSFNVTKAFTSITPNDIFVNGILTAPFMSINSNLSGDGLVQAGTYSLSGSNTIYGFVPTNGHKAAAQTWQGDSSDDWFGSSNWKGGGEPTSNKAVVIDDVGSHANMPKIDQTGGAAKSIDLDGTGSSLLIEGINSSLTIETYLTIDGGTAKIDNNGQVQVNEDVEIKSGSTLDVVSGSVNIGPLNKKK